MKLARYVARDGAQHTGVVEDDLVTPISEQILQAAVSRRATPCGAPAPLWTVNLLAPFEDPPSIRDFYAFEGHVRTARKLRGLEMDADWFEMPVFYFSNPATVYGPDDTIPRPHTEQLDYELEAACVLGADGSDLSVDEACRLIAGYTIFNDWSARDLQRREMKLSLGPSKGKDFASSFGPVLVTPEELPHDRPGRPRVAMRARVNGTEYSFGNLGDLHHGFGEMIAYASRSSRLRAGDVIGSGTCTTGCILEHAGRYPWLTYGDVVELEIEGIGVLRNIVG